MNRYTLVCLVLILFVGTGSLGAEPPGREAADPGALRIALHDVASITAGHSGFIPPYMGVSYDPEHDSLGPQERELRMHPHGSAEELIELVKAHVRPRYWEETEDANIVGWGETRLVIRATEAIHREVATYLGDIEAASSIQVRLCVAGCNAQGLDAWNQRTRSDTLPAWARSGMFATMAVHPGDQCVVVRGMDRSLVVGTDVVKTVDHVAAMPRVAVGRYGFSASVRAVPVGNEPQDLVILNAELAEHRSIDTVAKVQVSTERGAQWHTHTTVSRGTWKLVGASGDLALFLRTDVAPRAATTQRHIHWISLVPQDAPDGALVLRSYAASDLGEPWGGRAASFQQLYAPDEELPEPRELPDPTQIWGPNAIVELMQMAAPERFWERGTLVILNGTMMLRGAEPLHDMATKNLKTLRTLSRESVVTEVRVHDLPKSALLQVPGAIEALIATTAPTHVASVRCQHGKTAFAAASATHRYIEAYEIEATAANQGIGTPVVAELGLGLTVQVRACANGSNSEVLMDLRVLQQALAAEQSTSTKHGPVTLPIVQVFRGMSMLRAPMNRPTVAFSATQGNTVRVITVIPRLEK